MCVYTTIYIEVKIEISDCHFFQIVVFYIFVFNWVGQIFVLIDLYITLNLSLLIDIKGAKVPRLPPFSVSML